MTFSVFSKDKLEAWDDFVCTKSINGNFLQTRTFLNYHPEGRFIDASLMYYDQKNKLRAVIPAACININGQLSFVAHPGSTYGGIVIDKKTCEARRFQTLLDELVLYLARESYTAIDLRFPPNFLWLGNDAPLVEYLLQLNGFREGTELTTYIDYATYGDRTLSCFSQGKRTNVNNGLKNGLRFARITEISRAAEFYGMLSENLKKYDSEPVHTFDELWDLYSNRLQGSTELVGVFDREKLVASGWLFLFANQRAAHTQYLCADSNYNKLSPMTFLYYSLIEYCRELGLSYLSWGVSTEDEGRVLNWGLTESKESFGSSHDVHRRYLKLLA